MALNQGIRETFAATYHRSMYDVAELKIVEDPDGSGAYVAVFFRPELGLSHLEFERAESAQAAREKLLHRLLHGLGQDQSFDNELVGGLVYDHVLDNLGGG